MLCFSKIITLKINKSRKIEHVMKIILNISSLNNMFNYGSTL